jgi:hypothetical protein
MNASKMMARMATTTQKKNTMMPGMAYPATVLALATTARYPLPSMLFGPGARRQFDDFQIHWAALAAVGRRADAELTAPHPCAEQQPRVERCSFSQPVSARTSSAETTRGEGRARQCRPELPLMPLLAGVRSRGGGPVGKATIMVSARA